MDKFSINWRRVGFFIGIAVLVLLVIEFNTRLETLNKVTEEAESVRGQATQAIQTQRALETKIAYATSESAVEDFARGEDHQKKEGDIPVVPVPGGNSLPVPTPTPMPTPTPQPNWQVWWNLFFGDY